MPDRFVVRVSVSLAGRDGLITNDKFCFSRWGRLRLSWWRRPLRLRSAEPQRCGTLLEGNSHPGGDNEAGMDSSQTDGSASGRPAPLGLGLPVPSEMDADDEARNAANPSSPGGTP
jgi:hypothetical protein